MITDPILNPLSSGLAVIEGVEVLMISTNKGQ